MQKVELLSPARDLVVGKAAIDNGADAVYIGAPAFGARKAAANSLEDIGTLVGYAHRFYCRVFVTLNTILYDSELAEAEKMIRQLYADRGRCFDHSGSGHIEYGSASDLFACQHTDAQL